MTQNGILQIVLYLVILLVLVKPLGWYMAMVYEGKPCGLNRWFGSFEQFIYRLAGIHPANEMGWKHYLSAMLLFNMLGMLTVYVISRCQFYLPFNPEGFAAVSPNLAFNISASFVTNTDWQSYGGETTLSYGTQMLALTVQNFLSAATGMALVVALIRGLVRHESNSLGNFWVDLVRGTLYILLPLSFILAVALSSQGIIQNFKPYQKTNLLESMSYQETSKALTKTISEQLIPMGPVASQVAIKQLGSNGGGFFNVNAAHPFENPTPLSNFLEMLAILLIPAAFCYTLGILVKDKRQGWAIFFAMLIIFIPWMFFGMVSEQKGNPILTQMGISPVATADSYPGGNMEGKETRFGIVNSMLFTAATTATSNGSINAMLDSFTPLAGLVPLWLMHLGEIVFGGVGSGLYGMLMVVIITVFVAGLMVGRTPEYLGKKIEPFEMKMASIAVLLMPLIVLLLTGVTVVMLPEVQATGNSGAHGFTEILFAFTSMGNNNGSAFAGLNANTMYYNSIGAIEMILLRFWVAIPVLAIAGSLARKKLIPASVGTLPTHTPLFVILLIGITFILGALSFFPALSLGPIVEHLMLWGHYGH